MASIKTKKIILKQALIPLFLLIVNTALFAQQEITKIGVVDTAKIYTTFFKDSPEIRGLEKFKAETEIEVKRIEKEILDLKTKKLEADKSGDKEAGAKLDKLIFEKEKFLKEYRNIKNEEYKLRLQKMTSGQSDFILQVAEAIQFVAISEGYSIILEKQNPIFLFYSIEVDITDKVIEYLQNKRKTD